MKQIKNVLSFIISLILMFSLMFSAGLILFKSTMINEDYYQKITSNNDNTNKINENIYKDVNYLLLSSNIPQSISKDIITEGEIDDYTHTSVRNVTNFFLGKTEEIPAVNVDLYMERLNFNINKYILENNVGLTKGTSAVFDELKKSTKEIISSELEPIEYNALSKSSIGQKLQKVVVILNDSKVFFGLLIVDAVLSIILILLWVRKIQIGFTWIGYSLVSSGLLVAIVSYSGLISKFYLNAAVPSEYLKENISSAIEGYLSKMSIIGVSLFVIGGLFLIIYWIHLYKRFKNTNSEYDK